MSGFSINVPTTKPADNTSQHNYDVPPEMKHTVGKVIIWYRGDNGLIKVGEFNEHRLAAVSPVLAAILPTRQTIPKTLILSDLNPNALELVLTAATRHNSMKQPLKIEVHRRPILQIIAILDVLRTLKIQPIQPHIQKTLQWHIANDKMSPAVMRAVHECFGASNGKPWQVMIHQIGYDVTHGIISGPRLDALQAGAEDYPKLDQAIRRKIGKLKGGLLRQKRERERQEEKRAQRQEQRQINKEAKRISKAVRDHKEQKWYEEEHGLRETSDATATYLLRNKPIDFVVKEKKTKRGRQVRWTDEEPDEESDEENEVNETGLDDDLEGADGYDSGDLDVQGDGAEGDTGDNAY